MKVDTQRDAHLRRQGVEKDKKEEISAPVNNRNCWLAAAEAGKWEERILLRGSRERGMKRNWK